MKKFRTATIIILTTAVLILTAAIIIDQFGSYRRGGSADVYGDRTYRGQAQLSRRQGD